MRVVKVIRNGGGDRYFIAETKEELDKEFAKFYPEDSIVGWQFLGELENIEWSTHE